MTRGLWGDRMGTNWSSLDAARAALADPATPAGELLAICLAHPSQCAEAAMHPAADRDLLLWLSRREDPVVAATAQARLATLPPTHHQPVAPAPFDAPAPEAFRRTQSTPRSEAAQTPPSYQPAGAPALRPSPSRGRNLILSLVAGAAVLAVVVTGVAAFLPRFLGGNSHSYAPDFRERPGIRAVDAQAGLPTSDDQRWSTDFTPAPGSDIVLAYNSTSAFGEYRQKLAEYNEAAEAYRQWETDYRSGYAAGQECLTKIDQVGWYSSMREYCSYNFIENSTVQTPAAGVGFSDAVEGFAANPASPGSDYGAAPSVPDRPNAPSVGDNLIGIDLNATSVAWTLNLDKVWPGVQPSGHNGNVDGGRTLVTLNDPTAEEGKGERMLAILDVKTGTISASHLSDGADLSWASLHGDVVVTADEEGNLRGVSASDLVTEKWTTSAQALATSDQGHGYGLSPPPGYFLTANGYIKLSDGTAAPFARDAGQDGIQLTVLTGTDNDLIRVEPIDEKYDVAGFDPGANTRTWRLHDLSGIPTKAGGLLLAVSTDELAAYSIKGSELERKWSYSCSEHCTISFADDTRVFVEDFGRQALVILKSADGTEIDRIKDPGGYGPVVGKSVAYLSTDDRLLAYDLDKAGTPTLWRSTNVSGWLTTVGGHLVLQRSDAGILGIIGADGEDWEQFKPAGG